MDLLKLIIDTKNKKKYFGRKSDSGKELTVRYAIDVFYLASLLSSDNTLLVKVTEYIIRYNKRKKNEKFPFLHTQRKGSLFRIEIFKRNEAFPFIHTSVFGSNISEHNANEIIKVLNLKKSFANMTKKIFK